MVRGVALCERHFQVVAECAAEQHVNPASLSRPVIQALLKPGADAIALAWSTAYAPEPTQAMDSHIRPGFYWVPDEEAESGWTIVQVQNGGCLRIGENRVTAIQAGQFSRMIPIKVPEVLVRDAQLRRRQPTR
ncbi:MAG: hypothetical protein JOZ39_02670 [Chloroflexi bacterium]|nr:hypothetical protein [Chloroflexota bacterium]